MSLDLNLDFENFFQSTPCYLTVQDRNLKIIAANDLFKAQFGDVVGQYCYEVYKRNRDECVGCPAQKTFKDGQVHVSEQPIRMSVSSHETKPHIVFTSPVKGPTGQVEAVVEISADISLVKRLENKLQKSRQRYRQLFEEAPCYISVQDKNFKIIESNRRFKEDFGDAKGAYCYEIYKHRGKQCIHCPVAATFHDKKSHYSEEVVTSLDGKQINTLVYTAPIFDTKGEIESVMEMSTNITQIRHLQGRLTNLGMFVGSISHGVKGLLMSLDGGMYMLKTGMEKNNKERIDEGWRMVKRHVGNIRRLVLDLLYIAGDREQEFEPVRLKELASSIAQRLSKRAQDLGIDFQVKIDCEDETCELDFRSFKGSLVNILQNAFEACRLDVYNTEKVVRFELTSDPDNAIFTIEDNGIGMTREAREKMFSMSFSQEGKEGRGLGLFAANKVIEKHRGIIEADSELGRGTHFHIRIPRVRH